MTVTHDFDTGINEPRNNFDPLPEVVTLCGSTKFMAEFDRQNQRLTLEGKIVITVAVKTSAEDNTVTPEEKADLDKLHLHKIRLADGIFVINCDQYIGDSTRREIEFAQSIGRKITYLHPA